MKTLQTKLQKIGLTGSQSAIFLALYQYGAKPASTIAKMTGGERTNVYKSLQTMVRQGRIAETKKGKTKHFFVADDDIIQHKLDQQQHEIEQKQQLLPTISVQLKQLREDNISPAPQMQRYEGEKGIKNLFGDMVTYVIDNNFLEIKLFASNTVEAQTASIHDLSHYAKEALQKLENHHVHIDGYVANGIMLLEQLFQVTQPKELETLPAGYESVQLMIVGDMMYIILFKNIPFGRSIQHQALADMFRFLLRRTK